MGGGLIQLVAYGAQNVYLNCNPEITFFKVVYKKHTNFSIESIKQDFTGNLINGQRATCTINRSGDLLSKLYIEFRFYIYIKNTNISLVIINIYNNTSKSLMKNSVSCVLVPNPVSGPIFNVIISIGSLAIHGNQICCHNFPTCNSRFNVVSPTVSMVSNTILGVVYEGVWRISRFLMHKICISC